MVEVSPETLIAVGLKGDGGYVGARPPLSEKIMKTMQWMDAFNPDNAETVSHPDGDYTLVRAEGGVEAAQDLAYKVALAVGVASDSVIVPIYEPVSLNEPGSSPFDQREDFSELQAI